MSAFPQIDPETLRRQLAIAIPPAQASMASPSAPANAPTEQAPPTVQMASPNTPSLPAPSLPSIKAPRGTSAGDQSELSRLESTGSGISQIKSPWARIPLQVLDSVAGSLSPIARSIEQGIPGTQEHHNLLVNQSQRQVGQDVANEEKQATTKHEQAVTAAMPAEEEQKAQLQDAQIQNLLHPQAKTAFEDWRKTNPDAPTTDFFKAEQEGKPLPEGERPLTNADNLNSALQDRYQVLNPGKPLPDQYKLPANATQKDYERIDKALGGVESAQGTKEQRAQTQAMREQAMAIASQNRSEKQDTATKQAAFKAYTPAMDSAERFNVMAKNYEDAVKDHDQQAMLSLLANHLGMTMGLQKGARMNKDIIQEAQNSRPWLQGMKAKFDKDGILQGVTLTPEQMRQMVDLGRERFAEDISKAGNEARYLGSTDSGPERTPNKSVINHYLGLANGDWQKAKALAAQDGWTISGNK